MLKLINVFSTTKICVFWYTAPKEDKSTQKKKRKIIPKIKNKVYLQISLLSILLDKLLAFSYVSFLNFSISLSDKKILFNIKLITWEAIKEINIFGK